MRGNNILNGVILVGLGATSYGCLATFVKLAYRDTGITGKPFTPAEVISAQFILGIAAVALISFFQQQRNDTIRPTSRNIFHLLLAGTSTGLTSIFYYMAVKFIPVSIGIVLLMQTVWMGVVLEWLLERRKPSVRKIAAVGVVLCGTALATNLIENASGLDWRGVVLGLLAAASFTTTMFSANKIATGVSSAKRSLFMLLGGGVMVLAFALATQHQAFNYDIFYKWGILLALFGTVIPPILLNAGFPKTGIGLGSIVSSLELPVSVTMAFVLLGERVTALQWLGIGLILAAIVLMNASLKKNRAL
jgi:drug/metabolite transporter (DMT)-like permease